MIQINNRIFISNSIAAIEAYNRGTERFYYILVDAEDIPLIKEHAKSITVSVGNTTEYALYRAKDIKKSFPLHRLIMNTPDKLQVDHLNHDGLDNRKSNLKNCTAKVNNKNRRLNAGARERTDYYRRIKEKEFRSKFAWFKSVTNKEE